MVWSQNNITKRGKHQTKYLDALEFFKRALVTLFSESIFLSLNADFFENYRNTAIKFLYKYRQHSIFYQKLYFTVTVMWLKNRIPAISFSNYQNTEPKIGTEYRHIARPPCIAVAIYKCHVIVPNHLVCLLEFRRIWVPFFSPALTYLVPLLVPHDGTNFVFNR